MSLGEVLQPGACAQCNTELEIVSCRYGALFRCQCGNAMRTLSPLIDALTARIAREQCLTLIGGDTLIGMAPTSIPAMCIKRLSRHLNDVILVTLSVRLLRSPHDTASRSLQALMPPLLEPVQPSWWVVDVAFPSCVTRDAFHDALPMAIRGHCTAPEIGASTLKFPLPLIEEVERELMSFTAGSGEGVNFVVNGIPRATREWLLSRRRAATASAALYRSHHLNVHPRLWKMLHRHQREGVQYALATGGRALIADEMGVGKSLTAVATLQALRGEAMPCLVVCPATLRRMWAELAEEWLVPGNPDGLHVVFGSNDRLHMDVVAGACPPPAIVVISFTMLAVMRRDLERIRWGSLLVDESQQLKPSFIVPKFGGEVDAEYTNAVVCIAKQTRHCLMLSGTPTSGSPFPLYLQIDALCPGMLGKSRDEFALNYASLTLQPFVRAAECTRQEELIDLLRAFVMIRRRKQDVLEDLPPKRRVTVTIDTEPSNRIDAEASANPLMPATGEGANGEELQREHFARKYAAAWRWRWPGSRRWLSDFIENAHVIHSDAAEGAPCKVVLFAHHIELLDELRDFVTSLVSEIDQRRLHCDQQQGIRAEERKRRELTTFIHIDGRTPAHRRHALIDEFSNNPTCTIAIIGITSCAVGISLAAASSAVFCELPPDCSWLQQAEDRLHRPGQRRSVSIFFLVGCSPVAMLGFEEHHLLSLSRNVQGHISLVDGCVENPIAPTAADKEGKVPQISEGTVNAQRGQGEREVSSFAVDVNPFPQLPLSEHRDALPSIEFRISSVTQRVHCRSEVLNVCVSLSMVEAIFSVSRPSACDELFCHALSDFLRVLSGGHSFRVRNWIMSRRWSTATALCSMLSPTLVGKQPPPGGLSSTVSTVVHSEAADPVAQERCLPPRQAERWGAVMSHTNTDVDDGCNIVATERTQRLSTDVYPLRFVWRVTFPFTQQHGSNKGTRTAISIPGAMQWSSGNVLVPLCLWCKAQLPAVATELSPGSTVDIISDAAAFCSGECRRSYRFRMSSAAIRDYLTTLDSAVCHGCGVDCARLVDAVSEVSTIKGRTEVLKQLHPQFLQDCPKQAATFLHHPVGGNCWQADHKVPVACGGGSCGPDNIQTLCIPCHAHKTASEAFVRRQERKRMRAESNEVEDGQELNTGYLDWDATVAIAAASLLQGGPGRVLSRYV